MSRSVELTAEGELVLDYAQRVVSEVDGLRDELDEISGLLRGDLRLTVIPRSAAEEPGPPIELRPIGPQPFTWPVALVWRARRRQPPAAKAFLALAIARADEAKPAVRLVAGVARTSQGCGCCATRTCASCSAGLGANLPQRDLRALPALGPVADHANKGVPKFASPTYGRFL